jgi:type I restriction enzyme, S subunit
MNPLYGSTGRIGSTNRTEFSGPSVLVARVGANAGSVYAVDGNYGVTDNTLVVRLKPAHSVPFVASVLTHADLNRQVYGSGQPLVTGTMLKQLEIPAFAPDEQTRISETLGEADDLIAALERMIAKKQAIKKGMMQQLLTGKTRLPGFTAPWREEVCFSEICDRSSGYWGTDLPAPGREIPARVIRAGDIASDGTLLGWADRHFSTSEWESARCRADDVILTTSGNGLGKACYVREPRGLAASNFVRILRPRPGASGEFLVHVMHSARARQVLDTHTATSAYPNLLPSFFTTPWFSLPPLEEQVAIAGAVRSIDVNLDGLRARLAKARDVKQGMMQELLTGHTRLVEHGGSHSEW